MIKINIMLFIMFLVIALVAICIIYKIFGFEYNIIGVGLFILGLYTIFEILRYWHNKENPHEKL